MQSASGTAFLGVKHVQNCSSALRDATMPQRRKLTHPLLLAVPWAAFYVAVFGSLYGAYQIVYLRVELGTRQQQSIDALEANPASFVWYTVRDAASNPSI